MKIGVFDSGLGGLLVMEAIAKAMPEHDLLYLGDTKRVPYGNRSQKTIHQFVGEALEFLFSQDCLLVILACNTASAESLRKTQQEYLPIHRPDHRVLGVIIPVVEEVLAQGAGRVGVLATASTVESRAYEREFERQQPGSQVVSVAAPLLVPLIEGDGGELIDQALPRYLSRLGEVDTLVLGCTHYGAIRGQLQAQTSAKIIASEDVLPAKLVDYLNRHPEIDSRLSRGGERRYLVTDLGPGYGEIVRRLVGREIPLEEVSL